jgi:hypothetical protein
MKTFPVAGREQIYHRPLRLSALVAGVIVDHFGFSAAFPFAGAAAILALAVFDIRMPEAAEPEAVSLQYSVESVVVQVFGRRNDETLARSGSGRPKSAKARNRGR